MFCFRDPSLRRLALVAALVVMAGALVATAEEQAAAAAPEVVAAAPAAEQATQPVAADGLVVYLDPETGAPTAHPTADQVAAMQAALAAALDRSQEGLYDVVLPDGTVMRDLQGRFESAVVVRVAADGSLHQDCITNPAALEVAPAQDGDQQPATPVAAAE